MTSPVSMPAGHLVVAADMDAYENITGVWTDYSSSLAWTATTTNPVLNNGTKFARYIQCGKLVIYTGVINMGSTTTFGTGVWLISLPVAAKETSPPYAGVAITNDASVSTARTPAVFQIGSSTTANCLGPNGAVTPTAPFTWAVSDYWAWTIIYQAA